MSKIHRELYRKIWDDLNATAGSDPINLNAVDDAFKAAVMIDIDSAKAAACQAARHAIDTERTNLTPSQMGLPMMPAPHEYIVTGADLRVQKMRAKNRDFLARIDISNRNLATQFAANQALHAEYHAVAPYLARGMTYAEAVIAWRHDHPGDVARAAD